MTVMDGRAVTEWGLSLVLQRKISPGSLPHRDTSSPQILPIPHSLLDALAVPMMDKPGWAGMALPRCFSHGKRGHRTPGETLITGSVKPLLVPQLIPLRVPWLQAQEFAPISFQNSASVGFRGIQLLPAHPIPIGSIREGVRACSSLPLSTLSITLLCQQPPHFPGFLAHCFLCEGSHHPACCRIPVFPLAHPV